jgi:hypothetical protein
LFGGLQRFDLYLQGLETSCYELETHESNLLHPLQAICSHKEMKKPSHDRPSKCPAVMSIEIEKASAENSEIEAVRGMLGMWKLGQRPKTVFSCHK